MIFLKLRFEHQKQGFKDLRTVSFIINYTECKGAKIEIFTSIKDHQNLLTFILDPELAPETKFGSIWAIYFFPYYSPY